MRNAYLRIWNIAGKPKKKRVKRETDTVGPGIWQERLKNVESEKCTVQDLEYVYKIRKRGK